MAGIDTSIYQNALRPVKSVQDYDNEYMQGQQNKLMLGLQQQKADEYTRGIADSNQLRDVVKGFGSDTDANHQKLLGAGRLTEANAYAKSATEQKRAELEATKTKLETGLKQFETMAQVMSGVRDQASYDQARQQAMQILGPEAAASIPPVYDPAQIEQGKLRAMSIKEQMANHWKDVDAKLAAEKFGEDKRHNRAGEGVAAGNLAVAQGNLNNSRERLNYDKSQNATGGKAPSGYRWKTDGSLEPIPGGPITAKTTDQQQKLSDAKTVLDLLDSADPLIDEGTSSYAGAGRDQVARVFGASTKGAQAAAQLKALEGSLISKMPKMSGPQSDKDVLLYKQMAGQIGDPTIPAETKKAASAIIRQINQKYVDDNQPTTTAKPAPKPASGAYSDAEKERRYQEYKAKQGQK